jgi:hypothetical protein
MFYWVLNLKFVTGKKGSFGFEEMGVILLDLILISMTLLASFGYITSIKKDTTFARDYIVRDLAHLIETIYAAPGNVMYTYAVPEIWKSNLTVKISNNLVSVSEKLKDFNTASFSFASNQNIRNTMGNTNKQPIVFSKVGDELFIGKSNLNILQCGKKQNILVNGSNTKLFLDISGDPANGNIIGKFKSSKITSVIAASFLNGVRNNFVISHSRLADKFDDLSADKPRLSDEKITELMKDSDILVSLNIGSNANKNKEYVKAYYPLAIGDNNDKSKYLACKIVNSIAGSLPATFDSVSIIPVNLEYAQSNLKSFMSKNKLAVYIEIGNMDSASYNRFINDEQKLNIAGDGMANGIKEAIS